MINKDPLEGHTEVNCYRIGSIYFNDILTEEQIQSSKRFNPKSIGECIIDVYPNEGTIPHFHIYNKDKSFQTCVRIYENLYFSHGGKYTDKFNTKRCKALNEYLKSPYEKSNVPMSVWDAIVFTWELNDNGKYPENKKCKLQPDYEDMVKKIQYRKIFIAVGE